MTELEECWARCQALEQAHQTLQAELSERELTCNLAVQECELLRQRLETQLREKEQQVQALQEGKDAAKQAQQQAEQVAVELRDAKARVSEVTRALTTSVQERDDLRRLVDTKEQRAAAAEAAAAAAQLLCQCPGAARHLHALLADLEQQLLHATAPAAPATAGLQDKEASGQEAQMSAARSSLLADKAPELRQAIAVTVPLAVATAPAMQDVGSDGNMGEVTKGHAGLGLVESLTGDSPGGGAQHDESLVVDAESCQALVAANAAPIASIPSRLATGYLLLLQHMSELYRQDRVAFEARLLQEAGSINTADASGAALAMQGVGAAVSGQQATVVAAVDVVVAAAGATGISVATINGAAGTDVVDALGGAEVLSNKTSDGLDGGIREPGAAAESAAGGNAASQAGQRGRATEARDYMQREEQAHQVQIAGQLFIEGLMDSSAPGCRVPLLLQILGSCYLQDAGNAATVPERSGAGVEAGCPEEQPGLGASMMRRLQSLAGAQEGPQLLRSDGEPLPGHLEGPDSAQQGLPCEAGQGLSCGTVRDVPCEVAQGLSCEAVQVLALQALGSLMALSGRLAQRCSHVIQGVLRQAAATATAAGSKASAAAATKPATLTAAPHHTSASDISSTVPDTSSNSTSPAALPSGGTMLALCAVRLVERLVLADPNINGCLLAALEHLIWALSITLATLPGAAEGVELFAEMRQQSGSASSERNTARGASADSIKRCGQRRLLREAVASWARVLAADKLQLPGTTFALLGHLLLHDDAEVQQAAEALVQTLAGAVAGSASSRNRHGRPAGADGLHSRRLKLLLSVYSNTAEEQRQVLVQDVLLTRLLSPKDLEHEALVLPVLHSLLAARGKGQAAAACLLASMTPSAKALTALFAALEDPASQLAHSAPSVLAALRTFVQRAAPKPAGRGGKAAAAAAAAAEHNASDGGADGSEGSGRVAAADAHGSKGAQAKILALLDSLNRQGKGRKRKSEGSSGGHDNAPAPSGEALEKLQQQISAFSAQQQQQQQQQEAANRFPSRSKDGHGPSMPRATATSDVKAPQGADDKEGKVSAGRRWEQPPLHPGPAPVVAPNPVAAGRAGSRSAASSQQADQDRRQKPPLPPKAKRATKKQNNNRK